LEIKGFYPAGAEIAGGLSQLMPEKAFEEEGA